MRSVSVVQTTAGLTKYRYTNAGRIKEIITQNGIRTSYDYDEDGNVSRLTIGDGTEEGLLYDAFLLYDLNGNRTGKSGSRFSAAGTREEMAVTYRYDSMNRLTNEDRNGTGERYAYDLCGNRLLKEQYRGSSVDAAEGYRYNERNELTERIKAGTLTTCRYDRNGSIVSEEQEGRKSEYRYDLLNRQTYVKTLDGREQENFYDGEGLRAGMTENGRKTTFLYHNGEILAECDGESAPIRRYLRGIGLSQVQTLDDNVFHSCHQDEQGSTAYITGQGRETENSYQYDAFGNLIERKEAITNRILYTGQQYDQETGQYYLRARYYNPVVGRFLQEDTYRGDGLNLYAYCANNPVMYYDPSGHSLKSWFENLCKKVAEFFGDDTPGGEVVNEGGSKSKIGDFTNLEGSTVDDILDRIPDEAILRELYPVEGGATEGFEFKWVQDGKTYRVRVHNADSGAPAGSNAANGWILRIQRGTQYYDYTINEFQPARFTNPKGPSFDESIMNNTHIPIFDPYAK